MHFKCLPLLLSAGSNVFVRFWPVRCNAGLAESPNPAFQRIGVCPLCPAVPLLDFSPAAPRFGGNGGNAGNLDLRGECVSFLTAVLIGITLAGARLG